MLDYEEIATSDILFQLGFAKGFAIGFAIGKAKGLTIGRAKGLAIAEAKAQKKRQEIIFRMFSEKLEINLISRILNITHEEVKHLQTEWKKQSFIN